jgi:predicted aspartyl protease
MVNSFRQSEAFSIAIAAALSIGMLARASADGNGDPEDVLRASGLRQVGTRYLLTSENAFDDLIALIDGLLAVWNRNRTRLDEGRAAFDRLRRRYSELLQASSRTDRNDGPRPSRSGRMSPRPGEPMRPGDPGFGPRPGDGPPPPGNQGPPFDLGAGPPGMGPPPDGMDPFGPPGAGGGGGRGRPQGRVDLRQIERERAELEARMVLAQLSLDELANHLETTLREIKQRRDEAATLNTAVASRYAELTASEPVKLALQAIANKNGAKRALGPGRDLAADDARIESSISRLTIPAADPAARIDFPGIARLAAYVGAAELLRQQIAVDTGYLVTHERESHSRIDLLEKERLSEQKLSRALGQSTSDAAQAEKLKAQIATAKSRGSKLLSELNQNRTATKEMRHELEAEQMRFVRLVEIARTTLAALTQKGVVPSPARKAQGGKSASAARARGSENSPAEPLVHRLSELESVIHLDKTALDLDKHLIWVDATINDGHSLRMLFDPRVEQTRLTTTAAATAGARLSEFEPAVEVTAADGVKYQARRARLSSIKVGTAVLHDVECLVMPPEFGEAPSLLGGDFLNRFAPTVDYDSNTVTLTQLEIKPVFRPGRPTAR